MPQAELGKARMQVEIAVDAGVIVRWTIQR
jgi:hypothetical protein